ncbi:MAG: hypothetical protein ATN36_08830 [Epulopiscium sp. Nele67-Bin005]|nr:MAG: hypothetical protein ATN36_08830 [Epulopiscium sp. Nele67-Bin005]
MLYSIFPIQEDEPQPVEYVEVEYNGVDLLAVVGEYGYQIERLYSIDSTHFMDQNFAPGTVMSKSQITFK